MIITVTQYNNFIKGILDSEPVLNNVQVKGEISNYKETNDSLYFCIRDEISQMECFAYKDNIKDTFENGMQVVIVGRPTYLTKFGKISFTVNKISKTNNIGEQLKKLLELRDKLSSEGCFDEDKKLPVKQNNSKIGVVSSETGAVIHDITTIAFRRNPSIDIFLYPVKVQGVNAEKEIANGIKYFSDKHCVDVIIVARGGGSVEDLAPFNTKTVVYAINKSTIPVVSAVGHDIDFTFCDFASSKRAATPSEAAEIVTFDILKAKNLAVNLLERMNKICSAKYSDKLQKISYLTQSLSFNVQNRLNLTQNKLDLLTNRLDNANPTRVLSKGYALITKNDKQINSVDDLNIGENVEIILSNGQVTAKVIDKK